MSRPEWRTYFKDPEGSSWKIITDGKDWGMHHECHPQGHAEIINRHRTGLNAPDTACAYCDKAPPDELYGFYQLCIWEHE